MSNNVTKQDQIFDFDNIDPNEQNQNNFGSSEMNMQTQNAFQLQ